VTWRPPHARRRAYHLRKRYGITPEDYDATLTAQNGGCAICGGLPERQMGMGDIPARLVVDHDHVTGTVRGLLCFPCNTKLNAIEDEQFMLLARRYLRQHGIEFVNDNEE
jgi:hypothetical protein